MSSPSACPKTASPELAPNIYNEQPRVGMPLDDQKMLVASLIILLFVSMAAEISSPEVLFLIALMILCLAQVLSLADTLSGR